MGLLQQQDRRKKTVILSKSNKSMKEGSAGDLLYFGAYGHILVKNSTISDSVLGGQLLRFISCTVHYETLPPLSPYQKYSQKYMNTEKYLINDES